jgi:hypothetical protein
MTTLKTSEQGYNNMPPRKEVYALLQKHFVQGALSLFRYTDARESFWQNNEDTLVISLDVEEAMHFGAAVVAKLMKGLTEFQTESRCDECQIKQRGGKLTVRFWWD